MNMKGPRPPTDFIERARSLLRAMNSNNIDSLPDGTNSEQLEAFIQQSLNAANEVGIVNDTLKSKHEERDSANNVVWKVTKCGVAFIESRFGNDALQLEQVGRKRRSKYARPARQGVPQTQAPNTSQPKPKASQALLDQDQPAITAIAYTNGTHE